MNDTYEKDNKRKKKLTGNERDWLKSNNKMIK